MAQQVYEAIFENGIFRPLNGVPGVLREGQRVQLSVETEPSEEILHLATQVYEGLPQEHIQEIEQIATNRRDWFADSPPRSGKR